MAESASFKEALYWTVDFLISQARHIREGVHGVGIICGPHTSSCPSIVLFSFGQKGRSLTFVAGGFVQVGLEPMMAKRHLRARRCVSSGTKS